MYNKQTAIPIITGLHIGDSGVYYLTEALSAFHRVLFYGLLVALKTTSELHLKSKRNIQIYFDLLKASFQFREKQTQDIELYNCLVKWTGGHCLNVRFDNKKLIKWTMRQEETPNMEDYATGNS